MSAPRTTEKNQTESVRGNAASRRTKVFEMKSKSIAAAARRPALGPHGARLGEVEEAGGRERHHEIERGAAEIEGKRSVRGPGADLTYAHKLGQAGDRDQRRILERHLPEIAKSRQGKTKNLGH